MYQNLARKDDTKSDSRGRSQRRSGCAFPGKQAPWDTRWMETVILLRVIWALALPLALGMQEGMEPVDPGSLTWESRKPRVYQRPIRCGFALSFGASIHAPRDTSNSAHHAEPRGAGEPSGHILHLLLLRALYTWSLVISM